MYNPASFQSTDKAEVFHLMYNYPFATLISSNENGLPCISHLPLTPIKDNDDIYLVGHLAAANPHSKILNTSPVIVIFNGPHTYITPKWYEENDVPTWNYVAVHVVGLVELYKDTSSIIECLKILTKHTEVIYPSGWDFFIPGDLQGSILEKSIVGFKIKIQSIDFKKKLSQNRSETDRLSILNGLKSRTDEMSRLISLEMQNTINLKNNLTMSKNINDQKCDWKPPVLETKRMILRPIVLTDAENIFTYATNPNVSKYTLWEPHQTIQDSLDYIQNYIFDYYANEVPEPLGVALKENPQKIIGTIGCFWVSKSAKSMELAYALSEEYWGQGLVAEASQVLMDYCFQQYSLKRIQARCKAENKASARVMEKIGMSYEGTLKAAIFHREKHWDMHYYAKVIESSV